MLSVRFLTAQQVTSLLPLTAGKLKQQTAQGETPSESNILALKEEPIISNTKETSIFALYVQHPITWDLHDTDLING